MQFADASRHNALAGAEPVGNNHPLGGHLPDAHFAILKMQLFAIAFNTQTCGSLRGDYRD
jgi:hypothetical protein